MFKSLQEAKQKKLLTVNVYVNKVKNKTVQSIEQYVSDLSHPIKRQDFIPYTDTGEFIKDHKPLFKGWVIDNETSGEIFKTAKLILNGVRYVIYFDTAQGATVVSNKHIVDNCKYNDLAIYFESKLELNY